MTARKIIALLWVTVAWCSAASAEEPSHRVVLNIQPQPLSKALMDLGEQAGLQVLVRGEDIRSDQALSPAVIGELTVPAALDRLLAESGLRYEFLDRRTVRVSRAKAQTSSLVQDGMSPDANTQMRLTQADTAEQQDTTGRNAEQNSSAPSASSSRGRIEEVVVTAQRREQRLQDVPMSITAITADEIDRRGLVSAEDYLRGIPGVNQVGNYAGGQAIIIRGMEIATDIQNYFAGSTTGTYFGETATTGSGGLLGSSIDIKLVDIERVEVLRGPQGTAFGDTSLGGAVRIIPMAPKLDRFEAKFGAGYSSTADTGGRNYNFQGIFNVPLLKDKLAVRAVGYAFSDDGYYLNRAGSDAAFQSNVVMPLNAQAFAHDEDGVGAYYATGARISTLFQASDDLRLTLSYLRQKSETNGFAVDDGGKPFEQTLLRIAPEHIHRGQTGGFYDHEIDIANAVIEYDLKWADLLASYSHLESGMIYATPFSYYQAPWALSDSSPLEHRENVGEIRLVSKLSGAWNFIGGLYAQKNDDSYLPRTLIWHGDPATNPFGARVAGAYSDRRDVEQSAVFGEVSWEFLPRLTLTGGARYYRYDRVQRTNSSGPLYGGGGSSSDDTEASDVNFRANVSYKPNDNALLYAGWTQGFRLGRPQPEAPAALCDQDGDGFFDGTNVTIASSGVIDSDSVDNYEIGSKFALMDRRLAVEAAIFRMDWSDIPVGVTHPSACFWTYSTNAGLARSEGVELQTKFQFTESFRVDFGGSYIRAQLTKDVPAQGFVAGDRLPGSPKLNANIGAEYAFNIAGHEASVRADAIHVGSFYSNIIGGDAFKAGGYEKLDVSTRVMIQNAYIDVYVRNLTNEDSFTFHAGRGFRLRPRTIGVQLSYDF